MKKILIVIIIFIFVIAGFCVIRKINLNAELEIGQKIDSLNGVYVYYNGGVGNLEGRNISSDGYNIGMKYQCVEFVKRYYYEYYQHKMPDSYGNAKDFFDSELEDGEMNTKRNLLQFRNPSREQPKVGDLVVYAPSLLNRFGHVAIISEVSREHVEIIQQNPGPFALSRERYMLEKTNGDRWKIENKRILCWLSKTHDSIQSNIKTAKNMQ